MLCRDSKLHRFKLIVEPDLSDASLHVIHTSEPTPHNFDKVSFQSYRICEDALVSCWKIYGRPAEDLCGVYTGLTSARFANVISHGGPAAKMLLPDRDIGPDYRLFSCPASGRFILLDRSNGTFVLDFFWYITRASLVVDAHQEVNDLLVRFYHFWTNGKPKRSKSCPKEGLNQ